MFLLDEKFVSSIIDFVFDIFFVRCASECVLVVQIWVLHLHKREVWESIFFLKLWKGKKGLWYNLVPQPLLSNDLNSKGKKIKSNDEIFEIPRFSIARIAILQRLQLRRQLFWHCHANFVAARLLLYFAMLLKCIFFYIHF